MIVKKPIYIPIVGVRLSPKFKDSLTKVMQLKSPIFVNWDNTPKSSVVVVEADFDTDAPELFIIHAARLSQQIHFFTVGYSEGSARGE